MNRKVLVTGCTGFTGVYMMRNLLANGYDVYGLSTKSVGVRNIYPVNLLNVKDVNQVVASVHPDYVVHLAGISFVADNDGAKIYRVNLESTYNLLNAIYKYDSSVRSVLLASSANVYGNSVHSVIHETESLRPVSHYGVSKMAMENMAMVYARELPIIIARPFNYTGVGQDERFLIPKIVKHFKNRQKKISLGNIDIARDFGDVRQVVDLYRHLLEAEVSGQTYNICTGVPTYVRTIIDICSELTGHRMEIKSDSKFLRKNEIEQLVGNNSKLLTVVPDFCPTKIFDILKWMLGK